MKELSIVLFGYNNEKIIRKIVFNESLRIL